MNCLFEKMWPRSCASTKKDPETSFFSSKRKNWKNIQKTYFELILLITSLISSLKPILDNFTYKFNNLVISTQVQHDSQVPDISCHICRVQTVTVIVIMVIVAMFVTGLCWRGMFLHIWSPAHNQGEKARRQWEVAQWLPPHLPWVNELFERSCCSHVWNTPLVADTTCQNSLPIHKLSCKERKEGRCQEAKTQWLFDVLFYSK